MKVRERGDFRGHIVSLVTGEHQVMEVFLQLRLLQQQRPPRPRHGHRLHGPLRRPPPLDLDVCVFLFLVNVFHCAF